MQDLSIFSPDMENGKEKISFIIPALNEEEHVRPLIDSIRQNMGGRRAYEIVLVDNGSTDATVDRAKGKGARTFVRPELTIGGLRNYGVSNTTGDIIVFLDADVYLRDGWGNEFEQTLSLLDKSPTSITGSMCSLRSNPSWIEKYWFEPSVVKKKMKYINCAHLIMTKEFFRRIGEFKEHLETGEEWELCRRALNRGGKIVNNQRLGAVHMGYPRTLVEFFRRERWHGRAMYRSVGNILQAKPAFVILGQIGLLIAGIIASLVMRSFVPLAAYVVFFIVSCLAAAAHRCGIFTRAFPSCTLLYASYFIARSFSFLDVLAESILQKSKSERRWRRHSSSKN